jgi:hypothetical protein
MRLRLKKTIVPIMLYVVVLFLIYLLYSLLYLLFTPSEPIHIYLERSSDENASWSNIREKFKQKRGGYTILNECKTNYAINMPEWGNYSATAEFANLPDYIRQNKSREQHSQRIVKGILMYFALESFDYFQYEFKWLYRSWLEMQKYEPSVWRTDLIVFANVDALVDDKRKFFDELGCSVHAKRNTSLDRPLCVIMPHVPVDKRQTKPAVKELMQHMAENVTLKDELYAQLFHRHSVFERINNNIQNKNDDVDMLNPRLDLFYSLLTASLKDYHYTDSILMAFEGYSYFRQHFHYDFVIRADMDIFLTPLFAVWLPKYCNTFNVGSAGYSNLYNRNRMRRIAQNLELAYAFELNNFGSTWYGTPNQFRLVSYLTLVSMFYLNNEEFTKVENEGKLGTQLWPEWHYGVLLLL